MVFPLVSRTKPKRVPTEKTEPNVRIVPFVNKGDELQVSTTATGRALDFPCAHGPKSCRGKCPEWALRVDVDCWRLRAISGGIAP